MKKLLIALFISVFLSSHSFCMQQDSQKKILTFEDIKKLQKQTIFIDLSNYNLNDSEILQLPDMFKNVRLVNLTKNKNIKQETIDSLREQKIMVTTSVPEEEDEKDIHQEYLGMGSF